MTTDLVHVTPAAATLALSDGAWDLAQRIARTEFVPGSLRGKPEAVLACILTGNELGIGPMQSLSKIHVIDGRPAMAAELMRAVILAAGHEVWIEESSNTRVTVGGKRSDSTRETKITWTLDDAKRAGLQSRQNWQKFPRAMLLARATAELARAVFPDVLSGISYTVEELADGDIAAPEDLTSAAAAPAPAPAAQPVKKAAAKKAATRKAAAPRSGGAPLPPLPGEEDRGEVDEPGEQPPADGDTAVEHEARPLTGPAQIAVVLKGKGVEDRGDKLRVVTSILELDEPLETTTDLAPDQISLVLTVLSGLTAEDVAEMLIDDAEVVDEEQTEEVELPSEPMLEQQYRALTRLMRTKRGIAEDDEQGRLVAAAEMLGRPVPTPQHIGKQDAVALINDLQTEEDHDA